MRIGITSDHAGFEQKEIVKQQLIKSGYKITDFGAQSTESVDYPDVAHPLAYAVEDKNVDLGIALCGTGNGMAMALNKHQGVRAGICWTPEIASLIRHHNDANICVIPARFVTNEVMLEMIKVFLAEPFDGGRHQIRINKIAI